MSILQTTELKKYYGAKPNITRALDGVTLSIEKGELDRKSTRLNSSHPSSSRMPSSA